MMMCLFVDVLQASRAVTVSRRRWRDSSLTCPQPGDTPRLTKTAGEKISNLKFHSDIFELNHGN